MVADKLLKVGDKIIHFGDVFRVFKIKKLQDKKERVIFFKPFFKNRQNKGLVLSIPIKNLDKTNIRKPMSKKELKNLFKKLGKKPTIEKTLDILRAKEKLKLNDPQKTINILRRLWQDKQDKETNFTKSKEDIYKLAIKKISQEVAFVNKISLKKARQKIRAKLQAS